ncbi:MAG: hypothetical protein DKINENOH_05538 [bacterium]|nr:hypothetical protein [bacterium]
MTKLGKVEHIAPRELWPDEARNFTPRLASEAGLELLSEAIGVDALESVQTEVKVGPFNADILCRVAGDDNHVIVVENQFGKTDHDHLGKLITYASGLKAKTLIWIAETFTDEHRQALDWLNESNGDNASFFGLEIYAIRIGDSLPAPQLKIVSSPNIWAQAVRESQEPKVSSTKLEQQQFWEEVRDYIKAQQSSLPLRQPRPQHWYEISIGRSYFSLSLTVNTQLERVGCELYIHGAQAKRAFDLLGQQKTAIEKELDQNVEWQRLEEREACRIVAYKDGSIYDTTQRQELKSWLYSTAERFHRAFSQRVKALKLSQNNEDE